MKQKTKKTITLEEAELLIKEAERSMKNQSLNLIPSNDLWYPGLTFGLIIGVALGFITAVVLTIYS